jgi:N utilization substance protein A
MSRDVIEAVHDLARERELDADMLLDAIEDGLLAAYRKLPATERFSAVEVDELGDWRVYALDIPEDIAERLVAEALERRYGELERVEQETGRRQTTLVRDEDLDIDWSGVPEESITRRDVTPEGFGRIAASTARQVIARRLEAAERELVYEEYKGRIGEVALGIIQQVDQHYDAYLDIGGHTEALLPRSEQIQNEYFSRQNRVRALIIDVKEESSGPQIILSRRDPRFVAALFAEEVPEVQDGTVEIVNVAREPGIRAKIAVLSHLSSVDAVGACVGPRGARIRPVVSELHGERVDIVPVGEPAKMIARALQPARVREVYVDEEAKEATVVVPADQRALALGAQGANVRLASRLLGWTIDVKTDAEFAASSVADASEEAAGRCAAVLSSGKRCPNATVKNSPYCGIAAHQALAE